MKKLILVAIAAGLISTSLMAATTGTIARVQVVDTGAIKVEIDTSYKLLVATPEAIKAMYAAVLTTKSTGATIQGIGGEYQGTSGFHF